MRSLGLLLSTRETVNIAHGNHFEPKFNTPNHVTDATPLFRAHTVTTCSPHDFCWGKEWER